MRRTGGFISVHRMGMRDEHGVSGEVAAAMLTAPQRPRRRTRLAVLVLVIPTLTIFVSGVLMRESLPETVAFHWNATGRPDGEAPTAPLFWGCFLVSVLVFGLGLIARFAPSNDSSDTRKAMTIVGSVAGLVAAAWLVPAITTSLATSAHQATLGGWLVLFVIGVGYGGVTRWVIPVEHSPRSPDHPAE